METVEITYYENGSKESECPLLNGKKHGLYRSYKKNGSVLNEMEFVNGKQHGRWRVWNTYFDNIVMDSYYENDTLQYRIWYDPKGNVSSKLIYDANGKVIRRIEWTSDGLCIDKSIEPK